MTLQRTCAGRGGLLGTVQWQLDDPGSGESSLKETIGVPSPDRSRGLGMSGGGILWCAARAALLLGATAALFAELGLMPTLPPYWDVNQSVASAKTHVSHILTKLGLDGRVHFPAWIAAQDRGQREMTPRGLTCNIGRAQLSGQRNTRRCQPRTEHRAHAS